MNAIVLTVLGTHLAATEITECTCAFSGIAGKGKILSYFVQNTLKVVSSVRDAFLNS